MSVGKGWTDTVATIDLGGGSLSVGIGWTEGRDCGAHGTVAWHGLGWVGEDGGSRLDLMRRVKEEGMRTGRPLVGIPLLAQSPPHTFNAHRSRKRSR